MRRLFVTQRGARPCRAVALDINSLRSPIGARFLSAASAAKRDFYDVLGVDRSATKQEIKKKYRQIAKKTHPDQHNGDKTKAEEFAAASEAYEVLSDDDKRAEYDRFGHDAQRQQRGGPQMSPEDIFANFFGQQNGFGGGQRANAPRYGEDVDIRQTISFMDAVKGVKKQVTYPRQSRCESCEGVGTKDGEKPKERACKRCHGAGAVSQRVAGFMQVQQTCPSCSGAGFLLENPCSSCDGTSRTTKHARAEVEIPAGVDDGMTLRVPHQGDMGLNGGAPGDLMVHLRVEPDARFRRDGIDVHTDLELNLKESMLGCSKDVESIDGFVEMKVPKLTKHADVVRLRGKGIPNTTSSFGAARGDQYVHFKIKLPKSLTEEQEKALELFDDDKDAAAASKKRGFFENLIT